MNINCVVTDDEPIALEILGDYIAQVEGLTLVGKCCDALETMALLRKQRIDLLFLDIRMPKITGVDFIRTLSAAPFIILTTAYPQYALDGYDLDVADYLLKPISFDRFLKAIDKIYVRMNSNFSGPIPPNSNENTHDFFFVKSNHEWIKVQYPEIRYIQGMENYARIVCEDRTVTGLVKMKMLEASLPPGRFMRIHKSYIVNLEKVNAIRNFVFRIGNKEIETGTIYRKQVLDYLKLNSRQ
jgi:two-component system, LytTR family, response regulator